MNSLYLMSESIGYLLSYGSCVGGSNGVVLCFSKLQFYSDIMPIRMIVAMSGKKVIF
jgi:hypothetical protein